MSHYIAVNVIKGAHALADRAKKELDRAKESFGAGAKAEFPNTGYFLPVIYAMTGEKVEKLSDMDRVIGIVDDLLPPVPEGRHYLPYLGEALDAGMATLFCDEIIEGIKYIDNGKCPYTKTTNPTEDNLWLGAADDVIMRERGLEFVDGTAPGFAAIVGAAPDNGTAVRIARELQEKNLYVFMSHDTDGKNMAEQLAEEDVQMGWETRLVPFGKDITATVFALGFAARAAMSFGGATPGDFRKVLMYNKNRIFAFVLSFGPVSDVRFAQAAGAINYGFPTIADTDITQILPTGICTYEHVVSPVGHGEMVQKAIEVRGLKVTVHKIPIPVSFGPAFEGERIRKEQMHAQFGGNITPAFEFVTTRDMGEVEDGRIEVIGPEIDDVKKGSALPLGIVAEVAGRKMQSDFEPILERYVHTFINEAQGVWHMGQRDINWIRISDQAKEKGFKIAHLGTIIHAKFHAEYNTILDKVQVRLYTKEEDVLKLRETARREYAARDRRLAGLTDEAVDTFYSCTLCQSFAPTHVCVLTPERTGLCGGYNWLDGKAAFEITPTGPNQPIKKNETLDGVKGRWSGVDAFLNEASRGALTTFNAYSIMDNPMTSCGCFECIAALLPMCNGIMTVNREFAGMTPCGMKFSTLAGSVGGGNQTPGFVGHSKQYIGSKKFISADGGIKRLVWMPRALKEELAAMINARGKEEGVENLTDMICDETIAETEDKVFEFLQEKGHPAVSMPSLI
ncbi:MAG: acetyl-CoA decarbonylase/synthase complex subunit alpha/beta [bacterium]